MFYCIENKHHINYIKTRKLAVKKRLQITWYILNEIFTLLVWNCCAFWKKNCIAMKISIKGSNAKWIIPTIIKRRCRACFRHEGNIDIPSIKKKRIMIDHSKKWFRHLNISQEGSGNCKLFVEHVVKNAIREGKF